MSSRYTAIFVDMHYSEYMGSSTSVENLNEIILAAIEYLNETLEYKIILYDDALYANTRWAICNIESLFVEFCGDIYLIRIRNYNMELMYIGQSMTDTSSLQFNHSGRVAASIDLNSEGLDNILGFFEFNEALSKGYDIKLIDIALGSWLKQCASCYKTDKFIVEDHDNNMQLEITLNDSKESYEVYNSYTTRLANYVVGVEGFDLYHQERYVSHRKRNRIFNVVYNYMSDHRVRYTKGFNLRDVRCYHRISKWFRAKGYMRKQQ